ncbi:unnamed protein product [Protopolystoma xenopodis]|uniref:Cadherin domain-containing protein n=1 Tax=Protopolystoma xenopodis TaxID=117903 RepID=A0A448WHG5_9PLAT|nr:unnamed protein product [Protopolystoma xenopodis]
MDSEIQLHVIQQPLWGHLSLMDPVAMTTPASAQLDVIVEAESEAEAEAEQQVPVGQLLRFNMADVRRIRVHYVNSRHSGGIESLADVFSLRAYDGNFSSVATLEIKVAINPVNDEPPRVRLLGRFSVPLGEARVLTPHLFAVSDHDVPRDVLQIRFTEFPRLGQLRVHWRHGEEYTIRLQSSPITEAYLGMLNIFYVQNASALALLPGGGDGTELMSASRVLAVDEFAVSVSDGRHSVLRRAQILIRPANLIAPRLRVDQRADGWLTLDGVPWRRLDHPGPGGLIVEDDDTPEDDLILTLIEAPRLGRIERLPRIDPSVSPLR